MWKWDHHLKPRNQFRKWSKPWKNHFESYWGTCKHTLLRAPRSQQRKVLMYIFVLCFVTFFSLKCFIWRPIRKGSAVPKEGKEGVDLNLSWNHFSNWDFLLPLIFSHGGNVLEMNLYLSPKINSRFQKGILLDTVNHAQVNIEWIKMLFLERQKGGVRVRRLQGWGWQEQSKSKLIPGCFPSRVNSSTDDERRKKFSWLGIEFVY